ncbi:hypothetical protein RN001_013430 [Aquatica leii]|uniref:CST complex subunit CTC1 n=1 Tax=Aquatica leii TaxID=1421715 RepID=A0AAN7PZV5_9COLE|nr:hypothetical protein RN001_013430 [Aquatica leii]
MNYEGRVTSLNVTTMSFVVDNNITVHTGHLAARTNKYHLPEIGEHVNIYNAHFMLSSSIKVQKLFVCDRGKIVCEHYTDADDTSFPELIDDYNLGCSDLEVIDASIPVITDHIKDLSQNSAMEIMFEIVQVLADIDKSKNRHKCLNKIIAPLSIKTISDYNFVDSYPNKEEKMPVWFFGSHSKYQKDKLLGYLQINKRYGILLLRDVNGVKPCVMVNSSKINVIDIVNKFVIIQNFRVFTELYRENEVPCLEYLFFDVKDVLVLEGLCHKNCENMQQLIVKEVPENFSYVYKFKFQLLKKATVNVNKRSQIECWLEVLLVEKSEQIYLGFNAYQVQLIPLLEEGHLYEVYHSDKLIECVNQEITRITTRNVLKFQEKNAIFVRVSEESSYSVLSIADLVGKEFNGGLISMQGILSVKKLTPALSSRTKKNSTLKEFGTPGSSTHTLIFEDDQGNSTVLLYVNNWENLQMPLGLIPGMRVCVKNVLFHKKYLKSTALTSFEILSYEPPVLFDTVNLCQNVERGCDKYSYLGWGDLIPCNVLVWSRVSVLFVRSLKIIYSCNGCQNECACPINTTLTFYTTDEFGSSLVLSKSMELLRLLLGLEPGQWKIWCNAFKEVKEYVYNDSEMNQSGDVHIQAFCEALKTSIQTTNTCRLSNLELKCRKLDNNSNEDNDGLPLWFCVDARINEFIKISIVK